MSEENTATESTNEVAANEAPGAEKASEERTPESYMDEIRKLRDEAATMRRQRNELRADAEAWREKQDAEKSELQRQQEQRAELEAKLADTAAENTRLRLAAKYGIAEENLDFLGSGSPEDIEDRARRLAELQKQQIQAPPSNVPVEQLGGPRPRSDETPDNAFPPSWPV